MGDVKLRAFPVIKADTGRVEISNPDGFTQNNFAAMDGLSARVKLWPLFSKRVEIAKFTLINPEIYLEKRADGQANWVFGQPKENNSSEPKEAFKRDGRYANVDPNIGQFTLENGTVSYADRVGGESHKISGANVDFALPSLAAKIKIDGDFTYNDTPAALTLTLESIRTFLDGGAAPVSLNLKTDFADIQAEGEFLPDDDITARVTLDGDVSDLTALMALIPNDVEIGSAVSSVKIAGDYTYENGVLSAKGANLSALGSALEASFKGDAVIKETPSFSGRVDAQSADVQALLRALPSNILPADIKGLELLNTANISANLGNKGEGFEASDIDTLISGDGFSASYKGAADAVIGESVSFEGLFEGAVPSLSEFAALSGTEIPYSTSIGRVNISTDVKGQASQSAQNIELSSVDAALSEGQINGRYRGGVTLKDGLKLAGALEVEIPSLREIAKANGTELPPNTQAGDIFGPLSITGQVSGTPETVRFEEAKLSLDSLYGGLFSAKPHRRNSALEPRTD